MNNLMIKLHEVAKYRKARIVELLNLAVGRIDHLENVQLPDNEIDERDWKDISCDCQFIIGELVGELEQLEEDACKKCGALSGRCLFGCRKKPHKNKQEEAK